MYTHTYTPACRASSADSRPRPQGASLLDGVPKCADSGITDNVALSFLSFTLLVYVYVAIVNYFMYSFKHTCGLSFGFFVIVNSVLLIFIIIGVARTSSALRS